MKKAAPKRKASKVLETQSSVDARMEALRRANEARMRKKIEREIEERRRKEEEQERRLEEKVKRLVELQIRNQGYASYSGNPIPPSSRRHRASGPGPKPSPYRREQDQADESYDDNDEESYSEDFKRYETHSPTPKAKTSIQHQQPASTLGSVGIATPDRTQFQQPGVGNSLYNMIFKR